MDVWDCNFLYNLPSLVVISSASHTGWLGLFLLAKLPTDPMDVSLPHSPSISVSFSKITSVRGPLRVPAKFALQIILEITNVKSLKL